MNGNLLQNMAAAGSSFFSAAERVCLSHTIFEHLICGQVKKVCTEGSRLMRLLGPGKICIY